VKFSQLPRARTTSDFDRCGYPYLFAQQRIDTQSNRNGLAQRTNPRRRAGRIAMGKSSWVPADRDKPTNFSASRTGCGCLASGHGMAGLPKRLATTNRASFGDFWEIADEYPIQGNLVMDAHLAALAIEHGLTLCSADSDFAKFTGRDGQIRSCRTMLNSDSLFSHPSPNNRFSSTRSAGPMSGRASA